MIRKSRNAMVSAGNYSLKFRKWIGDVSPRRTGASRMSRDTCSGGKSPAGTRKRSHFVTGRNWVPMNNGARCVTKGSSGKSTAPLDALGSIPVGNSGGPDELGSKA